MEKLKTLQDLEGEFNVFFKPTISERDRGVRLGALSIAKDARNEAIKWIKELEKSRWTYWDVAETRCLREWIKHFFVISEEDLKNGEVK